MNLHAHIIIQPSGILLNCLHPQHLYKLKFGIYDINTLRVSQN
jgi:hypothetical protein